MNSEVVLYGSLIPFDERKPMIDQLIVLYGWDRKYRKPLAFRDIVRWTREYESELSFKREVPIYWYPIPENPLEQEGAVLPG